MLPVRVAGEPSRRHVHELRMSHMTARMACPRCDVFATGEETCWSCGEPMVLASAYKAPTTSPWLSPMLAHLNGGSDA